MVKIDKILGAESVYPYLEIILPEYASPVIIEIGAARGEDTALIRDIVDRGRYIAFEPEPKNLWLLQKINRIKIEQMAVGDKEEVREFFRSSGWNPHAGDRQKYDHSLSGSFRKPKNHLNIAPWCHFNETMQVQVTTLDKYCEKNNIPRVDFIWCDIQGAEQDMILGAQRILSTVDYLYLEYNDGEMYEGQLPLEELIKILPCKFSVVHKFPDDVLLRNESL